MIDEFLFFERTGAMQIRLPRFALAVVVLSLAAAAAAEPPFSFETTPGRLPKTVVPRHYDLRLQPDIDALRFEGSVCIDVEVLEATDRIVMNAFHLDVDSATFDGDVVPFELDESQQTFTLVLPAAAAPGSHALSASFRGTINPQANGLFFDRYPTPSGEKLMLGTQFEVPDARLVFPCWDEPVFRATFSLTAVVPAHFMAVSNMPVASERKIEGGQREVVFERTPSMSTYLLALFAGEFETLEGEIDGIAVRIITTEGKRGSAGYALESARRILSYLHAYFGEPYPLPKLDLVGVPNAFATFGAMENWGCISFIDSILLFDPETGSQSNQQRVFSIIAHEIAHQWFGNIVTMAWWDNLWLNEGFATWMGNKAAADLNPGWDMLTRGSAGREQAMSLDASPTTHPVQVVIADENDAKYSFDSIAYNKGRAILDMLERYVGEEAFRAGIRDYIKSHQYSNTTTADLWAALDRSSGRRVSELAAGWTDRSGFPVVHASLDAHGDQIVLRQERFEIGEWSEPAEPWRIPISIANTDSIADARVVLLEGESIGVPVPKGDGAIKLNIGHTGFYRSHYEGALAARLNAAAAQLPGADQTGLLADTWALVEAGMTPAPALLDLIDSLRESTEPAVVSRIVQQLLAIDKLADGTPGRTAFREWACILLGSQLARTGWAATPGETLAASELRSALIGALGTFGHEPTVAECRRLFAGQVSGGPAIPADIRAAVLAVAGRHADRETYDHLRQIARTAQSTIERSRVFAAMQQAQDPELVRESLALSLDNTVPPNVRTFNVATIAGHGHAAVAWEYAKEHLDALLADIPNDAQYVLVPRILGSFNERERADELLAFVAERFPPEAMTLANRSADAIRRRASTRDRELPRIDAWIAVRGT